MNRITALPRRTLLTVAAGAVLATAGLPAAQAQGAAAAGNPNAGKPLRVILPVSAGSGVDSIVRTASVALGKALNQPVVVENLPGAGGITGTSALVKAAPDGLTIAVVSNNHAVNPSIFRKMPFDALKDITPVSIVGETPFVLVAHPAVPAKNAKELVAWLKTRPGQSNYGSSGNGTIIHLASEMFIDATGVEARHIPYKGTGPQVADLIGGQVEWGVVSTPAAAGQIASRALRPIGVMGKARAASLPDVPTFAEQGWPDIDIAGWFAVIAPPKLPAATLQRLHEAVVEAFTQPEVKAALARQDTIVHPGTPDAATRFFQSETERYARLVKKADIKLD